MNTRLYSFAGGKTGLWTVIAMRPVAGDPLPRVERLSVDDAPQAAWVLRGVTSNERYLTRGEKTLLADRQAAIGRPGATRAALIPIRKNAAWWALTQDERRHVLEESSQHIRIGLKYLPAIARRLHHCRDLQTAEPFDFLTWFDFAPENAEAFEDLVAQLRSTPEWKFVDREFDIRLER